MIHILLTSPVLGATYLLLTFLLCLFFVAIGKIVVLYFKSQRHPPAEQKVELEPQVKPQPAKRKVKTITIDPDDITKICFKKSN